MTRIALRVCLILLACTAFINISSKARLNVAFCSLICTNGTQNSWVLFNNSWFYKHEVCFNVALKWTRVRWELEGAACGPRTRREAGRHARPARCPLGCAFSGSLWGGFRHGETAHWLQACVWLPSRGVAEWYPTTVPMALTLAWANYEGWKGPHAPEFPFLIPRTTQCPQGHGPGALLTLSFGPSTCCAVSEKNLKFQSPCFFTHKVSILISTLRALVRIYTYYRFVRNV